jgi:hypothetical protein
MCIYSYSDFKELTGEHMILIYPRPFNFARMIREITSPKIETDHGHKILGTVFVAGCLVGYNKNMDTEATNDAVCHLEERVLFYHINSNVDEAEANRLYNYGLQCFKDNVADYVLIDLKSSSEFSSAARKVWVEFLKDDRIKKTAIFGGNIFVRTLASFVIAATGKKNIRFFLTEEEARDWLIDENL